MNILNPITASVEYVIGPCTSNQYTCGFMSALVCISAGIIGLTAVSECYFRIKMRYYMYRDQQIETLNHPFIMSLKARIIDHTKDLPGENPIKSLAQKYIWRRRFQQVKDRVYSWIPFLGR